MHENKLDSQAVEILGKNKLINELLKAGLEVAFPIRDRGNRFNRLYRHR